MNVNKQLIFAIVFSIITSPPVLNIIRRKAEQYIERKS